MAVEKKKKDGRSKPRTPAQMANMTKALEARRAKLEARGPKPKKPVGGKRPGAGRPKGAKNIKPMESVAKLEWLEFDPIEMMVRKYHEIAIELEDYTVDDEGQPQYIVRRGSGAHAQLVATQGTLINNLMAYGYKKVPERTEVESTNSPMKINFSFGDKKETKDNAEDKD